MTTTINLSKVPQTQAGVTDLGLLALSGAQAQGAVVGLQHNTAATLAEALYDYTGDPATPAVRGKQALLTAQLLLIKTTSSAAEVALKAGRDYCRTGMGILKPILGQRWNGAWIAAGFSAGSLAVPRMPLSMLLQFRSYLETNPARESATIGFTAAQAQARVAAIQAAVQARETAKGARWSVKAARDASFRTLRQSLIGLRAELAQLLSPEDDRWYAFGFQRPADGHKPAPVTGLVLLPIGSGTVFASWEASTRAQDYRVTWKPTASSDPATEVGLFAETQATLMSLPAGVPITVAVSARNSSGETAPTEAAVTL
jgi:hypothetical protein